MTWLTNTRAAVGSLVGGALFSLILYVAGMPVGLIAVTAILVGSAAVLLSGPVAGRPDNTQAEATDAKEVSA